MLWEIMAGTKHFFKRLNNKMQTVSPKERKDTVNRNVMKLGELYERLL